MLDNFEALGLLLMPPPIDAGRLRAPATPFIALAHHAGCPVITDNGRHFRGDGRGVVTPAGWGEETG